MSRQSEPVHFLVARWYYRTTSPTSSHEERCANLTGVNLSNADLQGADFTGAEMGSTLLEGAVACNAKMPKGMVVPPALLAQCEE